MRILFYTCLGLLLSCGSALQNRYPDTYNVNGQSMFLDGTNLRYQNLSWAHAGLCTFYNFLELTNITYHVSFFPTDYYIDETLCDFFGTQPNSSSVHTAILFKERTGQKMYVLLYGQDLYEMIVP